MSIQRCVLDCVNHRKAIGTISDQTLFHVIGKVRRMPMNAMTMAKYFELFLGQRDRLKCSVSDSKFCHSTHPSQCRLVSRSYAENVDSTFLTTFWGSTVRDLPTFVVSTSNSPGISTPSSTQSIHRFLKYSLITFGCYLRTEEGK